MRFVIPINEVEEGGSQTLHVVDTGTSCARTNKRKLREYFLHMGVQRTEVKSVMKQMGFWGDALTVPKKPHGVM